MTAILALVSKSGFAELERTHGSIRPGSTVPVDAYFSAHKRLEPLASGGSLWMCTVRDGALWLVAVLENPRFGKKQWKAAPNERAVVDVSDLVGSLQFDNGKGLTAPPEKWGMSLQTPRVLSMADEALLRAKVSPSPGAAFKVAMLEATGEKGRRKGAAKTPKTGAKRSSKVTAAQALADVAQWRAASDDVRAEALASACAATGLTPLDHVRGVDGLGAAKHERSGLEFILVPGGTMVMGYAADDLHAVMGVLDDEELEELDSNLYFLDMFGVARPPRAVVVRPFFATRGRVDPKHARGFRLPSEAEWEWIAREGGAVSFVALPRDEHPLTPTMVPPVSDEENGWGFADLLNAPEPVADGWHPDYRGAPETSEPWEPGDAPAVSRSGHTWWQSYEEASALHAASRTREVEGDGQRLVVQVPEVAPKAQRVDWAARARSIFEGLCGRKAKDRTRAVGALAAQASRPGPDTVALAEQILAGFSEIHAKARAGTLAHLARAVQGAEGDVAESLRKQIDGAADALMDAMADKVPAVRANAAFLLSACGKRAAKAVAERMRAELGKERRTELRAGLLLALGRLGATTGKRVPELLEAARTKEGIVRAAAVVALVELEGEGSIDDERLGWLAEATAASPSRQEFPWFDGKLGERAYALVSMAALPARERAVRAMIPALGPGRERLAASALSLVFERRELDPNELCPIPDAASLTETQRALLEALAASEGMRPIRYEDFGLPQSVLDRQVWLGVAPPLFLETEFSLPMPKRRRKLPLWRWFRESHELARQQRWNDARWLAHVEPLAAKLGPIERLALELERSRYRIDNRIGIGNNEWVEKLSWLGEVDDVLEAAVAEDPDAARAVAERALKAIAGVGLRGTGMRPSSALRVLDRTMAKGETFDETIAALVPITIKTPKPVLQRVPADVRESLVYTRTRDSLLARHPGMWTGARFALEDLTPILRLVLSDRMLRAVLAVGAAGGEYTSGVAAKAVAKHRKRKGVDALLADFEQRRPIKTRKQADAVIKDYLAAE